MSRVGTTQRNPSTSASTQGAEVLSPNDNRGNNARNITTESADSNSARRTGQNFSRTANTNSSVGTNYTNNPTQTNSNQDPNEPSGKNAFENIIGKGRAALDKAGTTLMWGAGGLAGLLYLGLGWKKLAMIIGGSGMLLSWFLKTKLAQVGVEKDHHKRIVNEIRAMNLQPEVEKKIFTSLHEMFLNDAYKNSGANLSDQAKDIFNFGKQAVNTAQQAASRVGSSFNNFNNQSGTQPA